MGSKIHVYFVVHPNAGSINLSKQDYRRHIYNLETLINDKQKFSFVLLDSRKKDFQDPNAFKPLLSKFSKKTRDPVLMDTQLFSKNRGIVNCQQNSSEVVLKINLRVAFDKRIYVTHPDALGDADRTQYKVVIDKILKDNALLSTTHVIRIVGQQFSADVAQYAFEFRRHKFDVVVDLKYTDFSKRSAADKQTIARFKKAGINVKD